MYVLDMVGTIKLFIKERYGNNYFFLGRERFQLSGGDANQLLFLFGLILVQISAKFNAQTVVLLYSLREINSIGR